VAIGSDPFPESFSLTIAGILRLYPEVKKGSPDKTALFVLQTVEVLTQRFVTAPDMGLSRRAFTVELVPMIMAYLRD
jgi:hypothetical protein